MPVFATYDDMKRLKPPLSEEQRMFKAFASREGKTVFLSHSSKDNELVPAAAAILEGHGGKVYVDLGDDRLPNPPSVETAQILRDTIRDTKRFVLLISPNSKSSIWIPWELGLADGSKGVPSVALFPVAQYASEQEWAQQEYLGLYRRIVWGKLEGYGKELWMVYDHHTNTGTALQVWLANWAAL